jgi:hypothetical protein
VREAVHREAARHAILLGELSGAGAYAQESAGVFVGAVERDGGGGGGTANDTGDASDGEAGAAGARHRDGAGGRAGGGGAWASELRVGRDQAADAVAELSARVDTEVAAQARRARSAATEGRRRDAQLREVEAQLLRVTTLLGALEQRLVAVEQAVVVATARLGARQR